MCKVGASRYRQRWQLLTRTTPSDLSPFYTSEKVLLVDLNVSICSSCCMYIKGGRISVVDDLDLRGYHRNNIWILGAILTLDTMFGVD